MDKSYTYPTSGAGVNIYIIDSGIRTSHDDFAGRAAGAYTAINDGNGTTDCDGHGTHVAAIVGGTKYGVAKQVRLHSVRVLGCAGTGSMSGIIAGVDWVTRNRVLPAVANMSLGSSTSLALVSAVQASIRAGVVYTVAAGNSGADACSVSPANTPEALTVGATWNGDGMPGYSNYGPCLDLLAPGSAIRSAGIVDDTTSVIKGGTSMAAPHVAGVAALYLAANPTATPAQVGAAIVGGATQGVLSSVPTGTPNLLLFAGIAGAAAPELGAPSPPAASVPGGAPDQPPTASLSWTCPRGRCTFDASGSTDDKGIVAYSWDFGDGSTAHNTSAPQATYTYRRTGTFAVTLTVVDAAGQFARRTASLTIRKI
jgi:serine protease